MCSRDVIKQNNFSFDLNLGSFRFTIYLTNCLFFYSTSSTTHQLVIKGRFTYMYIYITHRLELFERIGFKLALKGLLTVDLFPLNRLVESLTQHAYRTCVLLSIAGCSSRVNEFLSSTRSH